MLLAWTRTECRMIDRHPPMNSPRALHSRTVKSVDEVSTTWSRSTNCRLDRNQEVVRWDEMRGGGNTPDPPRWWCVWWQLHPLGQHLTYTDGLFKTLPHRFSLLHCLCSSRKFCSSCHLHLHPPSLRVTGNINNMPNGSLKKAKS